MDVFEKFVDPAFINRAAAPDAASDHEGFAANA